MRQVIIKFAYPLLTVFFVSASLVATLVLVNQEQNIQNKAEGNCSTGEQDVTGACNPACGYQNPGNLVCDIPNGYCKSGKSCRQVTQQQGKRCDNGQCVIGICGGTTGITCGSCNTNNDCGGSVPTTPPQPTIAAGKCPNDSSKTAVTYIKFTCPGGCQITTENGVTAARCYSNRQDSSSPLSLNGVCGQVDVLDSSGAFCGYTEYTCGQPQCQPTTGGGSTPHPPALQLASPLLPQLVPPHLLAPRPLPLLILLHQIVVGIKVAIAQLNLVNQV